MRKYDELNPDEQGQALHVALDELLRGVVEGYVRFNDALNGDDLQSRIDRAAQDMDDLRTPWFLTERLMEDEYVSDMLRGLALATAEDAIYPHADEHVIRLPKAE